MNYKCHTCKATECKLWRIGHSSNIVLICQSCIKDKGYKESFHGGDQYYDPEIGYENWVPAVPDLDGSWWGYTSVPIWWVEWWKNLPDFKHDCKICLGSGKIGSKEYECFYCDGTGVR